MTKAEYTNICLDKYYNEGKFKLPSGEMDVEAIAKVTNSTVASVRYYKCKRNTDSSASLAVSDLNSLSNLSESQVKEQFNSMMGVVGSGGSGSGMTGAKPKPPLHKRFEYLEKLLYLVFLKNQYSLFITGEGGIGKTWTVFKVLDELGLTQQDLNDSKSEGDYITVKGYSTAKGLFQILQDNSSSILIFDDCDKVFLDPVAASVLKSATDTYNRRIVTWNKNITVNDDISNHIFEFTGKIVMLSNLMLDKFPQALQSRSTVVDLFLTTDEKLEYMRSILPNLLIDGDEFDREVTLEHKENALDFMIENKKFIKDFNIRTLIKISRLWCEYGHSPDIKEFSLFIC